MSKLFMSPIKIVLLLLAFGIIITGCQSKVISTPDEFYLSTDDRISFEKKADQGDLEAADKLANYYEFVNHQIKQIIKYRRIIAENGNAIDQYNLAYYLLIPSNNKKERAEGINWLKLSANGGDLHAQKYIARLYESGDVVEKSYAEAKYWYEQAAISGDLFSLESLSDFYFKGKGCNKDKIKAYALLTIVEQAYKGSESIHIEQIKKKKELIVLSKSEKNQARREFNQLEKKYHMIK